MPRKKKKGRGKAFFKGMWNKAMVAKKLGISPAIVARKAKEGRIKSFPVTTKTLLFRPEDVEIFLESIMVPVNPKYKKTTTKKKTAAKKKVSTKGK